MATSPKHSWTFLLLVSFSCVIYGQKCKWLHRKNEVFNKKILERFNQMIPDYESPGACHNNTIVLPNIDDLYQISQVESAALATRCLSNHIIQFYSENQKDFGWKKDILEIWDKFKALLLHYQENQLDDCIEDTTENHLFAEGISQQFKRLEKIIHDQHNMMCAQRIIHSEIGRNLRMANQLSSRMRHQHPVKSPL